MVDAAPRDRRRERVTTLLDIYALHLAPVTELGSAAEYQHHPAITALKTRLEGEWLAELESVPVPDDLPTDPVDAIRRLAVRDRIPPVYDWLATSASRDDLVDFLALEGGPDAGFDDLVAMCQVGLPGEAKLELARNYWDEMGEGQLSDMHTKLYVEAVAALGLREVPLDEQPVAALERAALGGLLATNRWLQPEFIGALGMTELQAGPRCRRVLQAFDRLDVPEAAYGFYRVHAETDPRHGRDWLDNVVQPLAEQPDWSSRMLRGAWWRHQTNAAFFATFSQPDESLAA